MTAAPPVASAPGPNVVMGQLNDSGNSMSHNNGNMSPAKDGERRPRKESSRKGPGVRSHLRDHASFDHHTDPADVINGVPAHMMTTFAVDHHHSNGVRQDLSGCGHDEDNDGRSRLNASPFRTRPQFQMPPVAHTMGQQQVFQQPFASPIHSSSHIATGLNHLNMQSANESSRAQRINSPRQSMLPSHNGPIGNGSMVGPGSYNYPSSDRGSSAQSLGLEASQASGMTGSGGLNVRYPYGPSLNVSDYSMGASKTAESQYTQGSSDDQHFAARGMNTQPSYGQQIEDSPFRGRVDVGYRHAQANGSSGLFGRSEGGTQHQVEQGYSKDFDSAVMQPYHGPGHEAISCAAGVGFYGQPQYTHHGNG